MTRPRTGALTTEWITDRAAFQYWKNLANVNNTSTQLTLPGSETTRFIDLPQKYDLPIVPTGVGAPNDAVTRRFVFGGDGADRVLGGPKADRLYGGGSTDHMFGGGDNDYLEGGAGLDVYHYSAAAGGSGPPNDGEDTIRDIDGDGCAYAYARWIGGAIHRDREASISAATRMAQRERSSSSRKLVAISW
jgi:hypothetical protein